MQLGEMLPNPMNYFCISALGSILMQIAILPLCISKMNSKNANVSATKSSGRADGQKIFASLLFVAETFLSVAQWHNFVLLLRLKARSTLPNVVARLMEWEEVKRAKNKEEEKSKKGKTGVTGMKGGPHSDVWDSAPMTLRNKKTLQNRVYGRSSSVFRRTDDRMWRIPWRQYEYKPTTHCGWRSAVG